MAGTTILGQDLMVFVDVSTTDTPNYKSIAYATNHTLEVSMEQIDSTTKDNAGGYWSSSEPGMMSWSMSTENLMNAEGKNGEDFNGLFDIMLKRKTVKVVFALQNNTLDYDKKAEEGFQVDENGWKPNPKNYYVGEAYITSLNVTATNQEKASYTATFTGAGSLKKQGNGISTQPKN